MPSVPPTDSEAPILVVDDSATDVFFLQRRLHKAGINNPLRHFEDGVAVVEWLGDPRAAGATDAVRRPWLVFVDLKMPRMDGFQVLAWLRDTGWAERLTSCVVSMSDEPSDIERAAQLGAYRFLAKYPTPPQLTAVVEYALRRAQSAGAPVESVPDTASAPGN